VNSIVLHSSGFSTASVLNRVGPSSAVSARLVGNASAIRSSRDPVPLVATRLATDLRA
jgi:hypothetical protein